jgi:hypothetical protein
MRNPSALKVYIIYVERPREYTNSSNKKISVVMGFVADNTGHTKMSVYNKLAFSFMKKGNCIMLINVIIKPDEIVATGESKLIKIPRIQHA